MSVQDSISRDANRTASLTNVSRVRDEDAIRAIVATNGGEHRLAGRLRKIRARLERKLG